MHGSRELRKEDICNGETGGRAKQDRDSGLMVGIAAGNLLGISLEGRLRLEIADKYPGGVLEIT